MRTQIIAPAADLLPVAALHPHLDPTTLSEDASASLFLCSVKASGLSGRALRKIPFLAHAKFLRSKSWQPAPAPLASPCTPPEPVVPLAFLHARGLPHLTWSLLVELGSHNSK